jgi:two-component system, OmpR family, sensor histidine kinase QseC
MSSTNRTSGLDRRMACFSLRRRLLVTLLSTVSIAWLLMASASYFDTRYELNEVYDAQLEQTARVLLPQIVDELYESRKLTEFNIEFEHTRDEDVPDSHKKIVAQLWNKRGVLLHRSDNAPTHKMAAAEGFGERAFSRDVWRVFALWDARHEYEIEVGERVSVRDELINRNSLRLLYPALLTLPVLGVLIYLVLGRGLTPLERLAQEVEQREPGHLSPLATTPIAREVKPLVDALNSLFSRLGRAFESERRFTADAAHELRTPLSALKTQAEVARGAASDGQLRQALNQLVVSTARATWLVEQLLTLARLDPQIKLIDAAAVDLRSVAVDCLAQLEPLAHAKGIELSLQSPDRPRVFGEQTLLGVLLRNLAHNAIEYSPAGSSVDVEIATDGEKIILTVSDSGPGISAKEIERVFDRFYRVPENGESGSGLGLSIVKRIVELHDAEVELSPRPDGTGLCARVAFLRTLQSAFAPPGSSSKESRDKPAQQPG